MTERVPDHPIDGIFARRWSPRSLTGENVPVSELHRLFEAARWAASSYNSQPWRFVYANRDSAAWPEFVTLLNPFNQSWAEKAGALIVVASRLTMSVPNGPEPVPSHSHAFDTGAACANLALQAVHSGLVTHSMVGFDFEAAARVVGLPEGYRIEAMIAVGHQGPAEALPEAIRAREAPNDRLPQTQFAFEGRFFE
ncbi:nitroreductase family protein [Acetobacteraceae bacterium KSS8]|uniref:Nitroreductase family protein n=1 Tax=Endosaccharibacter trunci TaxID=2812733 RepID=A0ABT1WA17_9PROT|nr:nitroreductase family protein [Acetobacteraceae bacterium KSS8]